MNKARNQRRAPGQAPYLPEIVDAEKLASARAGLPDFETIHDAMEVFRVLANPARLSIVHALAHDELSVGDLARALDLSLSVTSQQLSILRRAKLVAGRDEGRLTFYTVIDDLVRRLVHDCLEHVGSTVGARRAHTHPHRASSGENSDRPRTRRLSRR